MALVSGPDLAVGSSPEATATEIADLKAVFALERGVAVDLEAGCWAKGLGKAIAVGDGGDGFAGVEGGQ